MSVVQSYNIYLNSENGTRVQTGSDYVRWDLITKLTLTDKHNYFRIRCLHANIPFSFYETPQININGSYTHLAVTTPFSFNIPAGNYSITELNTQFKNGLLSIPYPHNVDITITYTPSSGKNTYVFTSNQSFQFSFTYNNYWRSAGFKTTDTLYFDNTTTLTSTRHAIVNRINSLLVRSDVLTQHPGSQEMLADDLTIMETSDIIAKIPIYTGYNSYIIYQADESNPFVNITNQELTYIQLYLTPNNSYNLDLREGEWTCALNIQEIERPKPESMNYQDNQDSLKLLAGLKEQILQDLENTRSQLIANPQE